MATRARARTTMSITPVVRTRKQTRMTTGERYDEPRAGFGSVYGILRPRQLRQNNGDGGFGK